MAARAGIEPATKWLTVTCSTAELPSKKDNKTRNWLISSWEQPVEELEMKSLRKPAESSFTSQKMRKNKSLLHLFQQAKAM